ncbi:MAG: hypothetical protein ACTHOK_15180 [Nocardioidaceae bacterium]
MSNHGWSGGDFRFPEGVEFDGESRDGAQMRVSIPLDSSGHLGRECPECKQQFRIQNEDYSALADETRLWCVYCGHQDETDQFYTQEQVDRLHRVAQDYGSQLIGKMLDDSFRSMARSSRRNEFVRVSYRSKPFYPEPLPAIDQENLVRQRTCDGCRVRYGVFGEHRFCPVCGPLAAKTVALDALNADEVRIRVLGEVDRDTLASLRQGGVLDRTYADTIENVVGIVEAFAERTFRYCVPGADAVLHGRGKIFQRLNDLADLYRDHVGADVRVDLAEVWPMLEATWAARHIHTHADGVVDQKYLRQVPSSKLRVGQRLRSTSGDAQDAIDNARRLIEALSASRP